MPTTTPSGANHTPQEPTDVKAHPNRLLDAEQSLRDAGRSLEHAGVTDLEWERLARVVFRLAQRVAVDSGRLERAA